MAGLPWYAHSIEDYERKTAHLTMLEHGAYRLLMDHYYKLAAPLPAKLEQLHRICRAIADAEQAAMSSVLAQFFTLEADGWHNHRADNELLRMADLSEKRSKAAKSKGKNASSKTHSKHISKTAAIADTLNTKQDISSLRSDISSPAKQGRRALSALPEGCPDDQSRSAAVAFWTGKGRMDLVQGLDDIADSFRDNHASKASRMADWPAAWRTWYRNALKFNRAPIQQNNFPVAKIHKVA